MSGEQEWPSYGPMTLSEFKRFAVSIEPEPESGCWLWVGSRGRSKEYGGFCRSNGHTQSAHRTSYEHFIGPIPRGLTLDHLCRTTLCVNPAHLEPVTNAENVLRGNGLTAQNARKTHCPKGHPYSLSRKGWRICFPCCRAGAAKSYERRRADGTYTRTKPRGTTSKAEELPLGHEFMNDRGELAGTCKYCGQLESAHRKARL